MYIDMTDERSNDGCESRVDKAELNAVKTI